MDMIKIETEGKLPYPYGPSTSDEEVLAEVLNSLHHDAAVAQDRVKVAVTTGRVMLTGSVAHAYERELAETRACAVAGVVEVTNAVTVDP